MNKISDVLIVPQPVVDKQKSNHLRPKILRRFICFLQWSYRKCNVTNVSKMVFLLKVKNINLAVKILIWKTLI